MGSHAGVTVAVAVAVGVAVGVSVGTPVGFVNSRRFGEPVPGLPTTPVVALLVIADATVAGVADRVGRRYSAAAPATCGVAIEVPLIVLVAVSLVFQAEVMLEPGAKRSTQVPKLENDARASVVGRGADGDRRRRRGPASRCRRWRCSLPAATA